MVKDLRLRCRFRNEDTIMFYDRQIFNQVGVNMEYKDVSLHVSLSENQVRLMRNWCNNWLRLQR